MRVSTVYQVDKDSLPMQRQELQAYCEYVLGIKDYVFFEDAGYSGKNTDRPDYQKMMAQIRNGLFTHLVVWKIDRISRNLLDFASMYEELKRLDVVFVSKNEQFDTSNAMGEAMLKIILVFAELERGMTSERVTATMINRASNGVWNGGRVPFGYDYDKETQTFSLNEQESQIVKYIFDLYEETKSVVRVSQRLNSEGKKSRAGNDFSPVSVWIILRNPWYKGTYRYNYYKIPGRKAVKDSSEWVIVEDHHVKMIDADRFDRLQVVLDNNARFRNEPGRKTTRIHVHIFAGLLWCAGCGAAYTSSPGRIHASGYRPSKYGCPGMRKTGTCGGKYISDPVIGEFLINYILNIMNAQKSFSEIETPEQLQDRLLTGGTFRDVERIEADGLNTLFNMLSRFSTSDSVLMARPKSKAKIDPELRRLKNEQKKQERALERLNHIYLYSENQMSDREYIVRKQEITDELQEINEAIGMVSQEPWARTLSDEDFLMQASSFILNQQLQDKSYIYFERLAENTDPEILKAFFNSVLDSVTLRNGRIETVVFKNGLSHTFTYKKDAGE
ncbi:MAG: recombinase family protein [Oscillospiraceae bacterium]|nr:recombinase family protein [Oscillospiraceae bacterium]